MSEASSGPGWTMPSGSDEPTRPFRAPPTRPPQPGEPPYTGAPYTPAEPTRPPGQWTVPPPPAPVGPAAQVTMPAAGYTAPPAPAGAPGQPAGAPGQIVRYGPGVPATPPPSHPGLTAEHVWKGGGPPNKPPRRPARLRRLLGAALTVILLAASGVLLYLRFHHTPFHVTDVAITQKTQNGCGVDVTGMITTNGAAGTISYQWVFKPDSHAPQPLSQTAISGQHAVYVTVAVEGSGQGSATQTVTLQILGPDSMSKSVPVVLRC
jgi:hypothetical protein